MATLKLKDHTKLIDKLTTSILLDPNFLDQNLKNNISIIDVLIQSGLAIQLSQLNLKVTKLFITPFLSNANIIEPILFNYVRALSVVCFNAPGILIQNVDRSDNKHAQTVKTPYFKALLTNLVRFYRFNNKELNDSITELIILIITLVSTRLKSFKARKILGDFLVSSLVSYYLNRSFTNNSRDSSISDLLTSIHCFCVLNKWSVQKSLIFSGSMELKLSTFSRKIWFLLNDISAGAEIQKVLDQYKIMFLNSCFNSCTISGEFQESLKAIVCLEFANEVLQNLSRSQNMSIAIQESLAVNLLELYLKCLKEDLHKFFFANLHLHELSLIKSQPVSISDSLVKVIYLMICNPAEKPNTNLKSSLESEFQSVSGSFPENQYLHSLMLEVVSIHENTISKQKIQDILDLVNVSESHRISICDYDSSDCLTEWVDNLARLLEEDSNRIFKSQLTTLKLIHSVGNFCCLYTKHYDFSDNRCEICEELSDMNLIFKKRRNLADFPVISKLVGIILKYFVINESIVLKDVLTINLLISLRKIFIKFSLPDIDSIDQPLFKFVCNCMYSKNRHIRIFAGKIFPLYSGSDDFLEDNWKYIFEFLDKKMVIDSTSYLAESTILAWGELAVVTEGEYLNVLLSKLFKFLSSTNSFYSCAAYTTLINVANLKNKTCWQLVHPFLPNLSVMLVQQIVEKTIFGSIIPDFLGVSSNDILFRTIKYTVPYLLTHYSKDIIKEIAKVADMEKYKLVELQLSRILAVMLTSAEYLNIDDNDNSFLINQNKIMDILSIVDPYFRHKKLSDLILPMNDIWEICQMYSTNGNHSINDSNYQLLKNAIIFIIKLENSSRYPSSDESLKFFVGNKYNLSQPNSPEDEKILQDCFKSTLLGIIRELSDVLKNTKGRTPYLEKVKSLSAIEFLVQVAGLEIVTALPQICISLQKAIADPLLELNSLRCWKMLILNLKDIHLITCFDLVVAIILQRWKYFSTYSKKVAKDILVELFNKEDLIREKYFNYYFTLSFNYGLVDVYYKASKVLKSKKSSYSDDNGSMVLNLLYDISRRCDNDNKYVVQQALVDLKNFLSQYKLEFHAVFVLKKKFIEHISNLTDILLNNCSKFKYQRDSNVEESFNIPKECASCLGIIGCLDPDVFEHTVLGREVCMFSNERELLQFIPRLLNILVKAFWASEEPTFQTMLAYGLQEFLKIIDVGDLSSVPVFNDLTISTLTPLAFSKYELGSSRSEKLKKYPLFKLEKSHVDWVKDFTLDLIERSRLSCENDDGKKVNEIKFYSIYSTVIKNQDLSISLIILPYVVLNMIVKDYKDAREIILNEFLMILNTDCDVDTYSLEVSKNIRLLYQTVFRIVDYLNEWLFDRRQRQLGSRKSKRTIIFGCTNEEGIRIVELFLTQIPDMLVAKRSSQCASYERAILYLEKSYRHIKSDPQNKNKNNEKDLIISKLQEMYEKVDDYDTLTGSLKLFSTANIESAVSQLQYEDNWKSILNVFDVMSDADSNYNDELNVKFLQYLNKKELHTEALSRVKKFDDIFSIDNNLTLQNVPAELMESALLASTMVCDTDNLKKWISIAGISPRINDSDFLITLLISKALYSLRGMNNASFTHIVDKCHSTIASLLSLSTTSSLTRNKQLLDKLHILEDMKELVSLKDERGYTTSNAVFKSRVANAGSDFESSWLILTMRKNSEQLFDNSSIPEVLKTKNISDIWLQRSKLELEHNRLDLASRSATQSYMLSKNSEAEFQYAEILWSQGDFSKALKLAQSLKDKEGFSVHQKAKIQLKYAYWLESSNNALGSEIVEEFRRAIRLDRQLEDPYYYIGKYYTKVLESWDATGEVPELSVGYYECEIIHYYLQCIGKGTKYLQEIFPKIVTLWLDFALIGQQSEEHNEKLNMIQQEIASAIEVLPKYYWFAVFSQLLSRLPSTKGKTTELIIRVCAVLLQYYPQQLIWAIFAQSNSEDKAVRANIAKKIITRFVKSECKLTRYESNRVIFSAALKFLQTFYKMAKVNKNKNVAECSLENDFGFDHTVLPAPVVVPTKENFDILSSTCPLEAGNDSITIVRFDDYVKVMPSLQRPRRIKMTGSDGKHYLILFKLNDDLRKDAKLMELTGMIHHLLLNNYESKKRKLQIKTFAVVPLNELYGIIEWVPHHATVRSIIDQKYLRRDSLNTIRKKWEQMTTLPQKIAHFKYLTNYFEPVLYKWFIEFFPTPDSWYNSRNSFARSSAVMSMVGFVLGIGDRHFENILISETNGSVLHVDFDCLFEKGTTLKVPERVPFRLTNNMVDACGIVGVEGTFRKSLEVTMQLLRNNEPILMNILEAFIHDPIMDWKSSRLGSPASTLAKIRDKLRGILEKEALPMSISGQVDYLIRQATSAELLCQMYIGWMPFW